LTWKEPPLLGHRDCFPREYSRGVKLTAFLHQFPRLRMSGFIPLLPLYAFMACTRTDLFRDTITFLQKVGVACLRTELWTNRRRIFLLTKPTWCTIFLSMFISFLCMFRAIMCPSSGEMSVSMRHLVFVTVWMTVWYVGWSDVLVRVTVLRNLRGRFKSSVCSSDQKYFRMCATFITPLVFKMYSLEPWDLLWRLSKCIPYDLGILYGDFQNVFPMTLGSCMETFKMYSLWPWDLLWRLSKCIPYDFGILYGDFQNVFPMTLGSCMETFKMYSLWPWDLVWRLSKCIP